MKFGLPAFEPRAMAPTPLMTLVDEIMGYVPMPKLASVFAIFSVLAPAIESGPLTATRSLLAGVLKLKSKLAPPPMFALASVSVATEVEFEWGARWPPELTVTRPEIVPEPPRVPPLLTL